jgi:hypothetical protein
MTFGTATRRSFGSPVVHPKVAQERLGHATVTTTLDLYSHVTATMPGGRHRLARHGVPCCYKGAGRAEMGSSGSYFGSGGRSNPLNR